MENIPTREQSFAPNFKTSYENQNLSASERICILQRAVIININLGSVQRVRSSHLLTRRQIYTLVENQSSCRRQKLNDVLIQDLAMVGG